MQQTIDNLENGGLVRSALNANFTELYGSVTLPVKLPGTNVNTSLVVPINTFIPWIFIRPVAGAPVIQVGTQPAGEQILPLTAVAGLIPIAADADFTGGAGTIYFTISGGTVDISILMIKSLF